MKKVSGLKALVLAAVLGVSVFGLAGCSSGPSAEQLEQLSKLRNEVSQMEKQINGLKDEKAKLERDIAERNKQLEECAKVRQETEANLRKMTK